MPHIFLKPFRYGLLITSLFAGQMVSAHPIQLETHIQEDSVPAKKRTDTKQYLSAKEAFDALHKVGAEKILFLDVRTRAEVMYVGMSTLVDAQVPYVEHPEITEWDEKINGFRLEPNNHFGNEVKRRLSEKGLTLDSPVILMCRSGDRSSHAASQLKMLGFTNVYSIVDGFEGDMDKNGRRSINGWKNAELPWSYKMDKNKVYLPE
jgi:rhodanese-related sulfurtransferase